MSVAFRSLSFGAALTVLLSSAPHVAAQLTGAVCLTGFQWMTNSKDQSPCLVAAYLDSVCNPDPTSAYVQALNPGDHYTLPTTAASPCFCNTVFYSVIGACAACQDDDNLPWSSWIFNCTGGSTVGQFPMTIPAGTAVPAWAYQDVVTTDHFNVSVAEAFAAQDHPDSTAPAQPSFTPPASASSGTLTPAFPTTGNSAFSSIDSTPTGGPVNDTSSSKKSNVGPIVGGVVGGIGGLALILAAVWLWMRHRRTSQRPASAQFGAAPPPPSAAPLMQPSMPWSPGSEAQEKEYGTPSPGLPEFPAQTRLYNPDDPSTFPSATSPDAATNISRNSAYTQQSNMYQPARYNGVAEL